MNKILLPHLEKLYDEVEKELRELVIRVQKYIYVDPKDREAILESLEIHSKDPNFIVNSNKRRVELESVLGAISSEIYYIKHKND